jgi:HD-GYP domain-containing protein (c-di-GMP phosphodiesterase class II)
VPPGQSVATVAVILAGAGGGLLVAWHALRLHWVSHRFGPFVASIAFAAVGLTSLAGLDSLPYSSGFWFVHGLAFGGILLGALALGVAHRVHHTIYDTLRPVIRRDPLVALELGLSPEVKRFIDALEEKDPVTRDHVARCAEIALRTGERMGIHGVALRWLGIGALLHDVGKLDVPDAILTKPGRLTAAEYEVVKLHTVIGADTIAAIPCLSGAAPLVRSHHERPDGTGYPDRIAGDDVPLASRIIAVCDAYDAIVNTRHYRIGQGHERACAILREHAGTQWDPTVVEQVIATVDEMDPADDQSRSGVLVAIGHKAEVVGCGCDDALPIDVREELAVAADGLTPR